MPDPEPGPPVGELEALGRLAALLPRSGPGETWFGDDAAVIQAPSGLLVLAIDTVVAGIHADLALTSPADLGWKALVSNLSDLAAMGADPLRAVVSVAGASGAFLDGLYQGLLEASDAYGCPIVGGDLTGGDRPVVSVAVTGSVPEGEAPPVLRSGAQPGDLLHVTGPVGAAAAGLEALRAGERDGPLVDAHRRPVPRLAAGRAARRAGATAMIDVSDGLALDLWRLCAASGVGADLEEVPLAPGARLDQGLGGGEDYELVMAAPEGADLTTAFRGAGLPEPRPIGVCTAGAGVLRLAGEPLEPTGWEHRLG